MDRPPALASATSALLAAAWRWRCGPYLPRPGGGDGPWDCDRDTGQNRTRISHEHPNQRLDLLPCNAADRGSRPQAHTGILYSTLSLGGFESPCLARSLNLISWWPDLPSSFLCSRTSYRPSYTNMLALPFVPLNPRIRRTGIPGRVTKPARAPGRQPGRVRWSKALPLSMFLQSAALPPV